MSGSCNWLVQFQSRPCRLLYIHRTDGTVYCVNHLIGRIHFTLSLRILFGWHGWTILPFTVCVSGKTKHKTVLPICIWKQLVEWPTRIPNDSSHADLFRPCRVRTFDRIVRRHKQRTRLKGTVSRCRRAHALNGKRHIVTAVSPSHLNPAPLGSEPSVTVVKGRMLLWLFVR